MPMISKTPKGFSGRYCKMEMRLRLGLLSLCKDSKDLCENKTSLALLSLLLEEIADKCSRGQTSGPSILLPYLYGRAFSFWWMELAWLKMAWALFYFIWLLIPFLKQNVFKGFVVTEVAKCWIIESLFSPHKICVDISRQLHSQSFNILTFPLCSAVDRTTCVERLLLPVRFINLNSQELTAYVL